MVVSADVTVGGVKELETLAGEVGVTFSSDLSQKPVDIVDAALRERKPLHGR